MLIRARKRAAFVHLDDVEIDANAVQTQLPNAEPDPESAFRKHELLSAMRSEVKRIPPLLREPLVLRDLQGRAMDDVARELGISVVAVKSRLNRARTELRVRMQRHLQRHA